MGITEEEFRIIKDRLAAINEWNYGIADYVKKCPHCGKRDIASFSIFLCKRCFNKISNVGAKIGSNTSKILENKKILSLKNAADFEKFLMIERLKND